MRARFQVHVLEDAVEVVHDADVVAVGEDLRVARRASNADAAVRTAWNRIEVASRRVAIWIIAAGSVIAAKGVARTVHVRTVYHDADDLRPDEDRLHSASCIRVRVVRPHVPRAVAVASVVVAARVVPAVVVAAVVVAAVVVGPRVAPAVAAPLFVGAPLLGRARLRFAARLHLPPGVVAHARLGAPDGAVTLRRLGAGAW